MFAVSLVTIAARNLDNNKERITIQGSVVRIATKSGKQIGDVTFKGTTRHRLKQKGSGTFEITFDPTRKTVRKMIITGQGTRNGKAVNGMITSDQRMTYGDRVRVMIKVSR